jgi:hypothetical protein
VVLGISPDDESIMRQARETICKPFPLFGKKLFPVVSQTLALRGWALNDLMSALPCSRQSKIRNHAALIHLLGVLIWLPIDGVEIRPAEISKYQN